MPFTRARAPLISLSSPVWRGDYFIGVVGLDVDLDALMNGVMRDVYTLQQRSKWSPMLIDHRGYWCCVVSPQMSVDYKLSICSNVVHHPNLESPTVQPLSIALIEHWPQKYADELVRQMLATPRGEMTVSVQKWNNTAATLLYQWQQVREACKENAALITKYALRAAASVAIPLGDCAQRKNAAKSGAAQPSCT